MDLLRRARNRTTIHAGASHELRTQKEHKTAPLAGKVKTTVFWDIIVVILVNIMQKGTTVNSETYVAILQRLKRGMHKVQSDNKMEGVLLHDELHRKPISEQ
jgi:N6-adenosine-specific RNA methylase IME4